MEVEEGKKLDRVSRFVDIECAEVGMVLGGTKGGVDEVGEGLKVGGYGGEGIEGELREGKGMVVVGKF
ncbi:hypothetical protein, partial [Bacillus subtilis]|uniref:hypothetical protein n=1 Tax=Bacillus subtilis TaxID=1423 RepID=UPI003F4CFDC7